jgi:glycosyltransferase involved in cell wall biosynthesis
MGPQELVEEGRNGFVTSDKEQFEAALNRLVDNEELRKEMGKNAREYAKTRSWDSIYEQLVAYYESVLRDRKIIEVRNSRK